MSQIFSPSGAKVLSSYIQKIVMDMTNQFYQPKLFRNLKVIRNGFHLGDINGSSSAWD